MPNEFSNMPYDIAHKTKNPLKRSPVLPSSDKKTLDPEYLLKHENHFDPNITTPEGAAKNLGMFDTNKPVKKA